MRKAIDIGCGEQPFVNLCKHIKEIDTVLQSNTDYIKSSKFLSKFDVLETMDFRKEVNPTYQYNFTEVPYPIKDEEYDLVYSSHTLEHAGRNFTHKILMEWKRLLKPGGTLFIVVPNIKWAAERIMSTPKDDNELIDESALISVLYGDQSYKGNWHYNGFTEQMLKRELEIINIVPMEIYYNSAQGYDLIIQGIKK